MTVSKSGTSAPSLSGRRVVLVLAWSVLGGAERGAFMAATYLRDESGADVSVLALTSEHGRTRELFTSHGFLWHAQPTDWHGGRARKAQQLRLLARRLRALQPDVLLAYTSRPNVLCGLVWRATGASLSVWNQQDVIRAEKFGRRLTAFAVRHTPLFIANSEAASDFLVRELGAPRERVNVVLAGVKPIDVASLRGVWREKLDLANGVPVVSMLAHLHSGKDHATLLHAWRIVLDEIGERAPVLLLAGRPSGTEDLTKALAFDLELGRSVRFLGDVDTVDGVLAASDVAVLSSRSESRPHALLESAAVGLPIAGTDVPGIRGTVGVHQAPFLAPPGDAKELARILIALISDSALRERLGKENRRVTLEEGSSNEPTMAELIARALRR